MELSELIFKSNTTDLERVSKVIGGLVTDITQLDKVSRDAAKTEATLAKAAKDNAKANLDNAKAQDVRLKSTITADKADQQSAVTTEKKTKATEKATEATVRQTGVLQKQKDILEFQTQGFSKGQAGILAYGKAAGLAANDIEELGKVLETQRKLMGGDPFDKSLSGLKSLQNQYTELKESVRQYATDSNLSAKQTRELARDKERLIEKMKVEGASFSDIRKAVRAHNEEYVNLATSYNKMTSAEDAVIKGRKEAVNATNYLTQADAKMAAALNTSNAALDKAGTDSLVKYETALRKSGVSQDVATAKLAKYKTQLTQVAGIEEKRRAQHLARALQPQFTDIAVSLYSGQAPLTVLLQQSGQMVDLFKLSGIEAANLGKVMKEAFASMIPAIATVAKGLGSLVVESFLAAGAGVTNFVGKITGINAAMEIAKRAIVSGGEANFKYIASLDKMGKTFSMVAATGVAALIAGLILLALEYKKIIQIESELSVALATSGGALGITRDQAVATAQSMESLGIGTLKAMGAISEIAKAGNIGKDSLELITKAAIDLEKTAGVSIEETAKQYAKLQEDPAKALTDIAQKTGLVDKATLDYVYSLEQQGDKTEAARTATLALASAHAQVASEIRDNLSPIEALWNDIKSAIGRVKQEIYDLTTSNAVVGALRTVWEAVSVTISEVWFTIKGVGKEIGGIGAQIAAVMRGDFSQAAEIGKQMKIDAVAARQAQDKFTASLMDRSKQETKFFNQSKEQNSEYAKWRRENARALDEGISKGDKYKAKQLEMQKAVLAGTITQTEADKTLAGWKKIIMGDSKKKDPSENYYATLMREATNASIKADDATKSLTASQIKMLEVIEDPRFLKLSETQRSNYLALMASNAATEMQTKSTEELADAEDRLLAILGKSSGIGRKYYADLEAMEKDAKLTGKTREEIEELTRALFKSTPAWKAYEKALEDVNTASRKFQEDSLASQASVLQENRSLDHRLSLLGKTAEEQKALTSEYQRAAKIDEVNVKLKKKLRDIEEDIAEARKKGLPENEYSSLVDAKVQAERDAAEEIKAINREIAVKAAEDFDEEFRKIKSGISDSITTALFEGGKAGRDKLRNVIVEALKRPITLTVNAIVNTLMNNALGGLVGGAGGVVGQAGSSLIGNAAGSAAGSLLGGAVGMLGSVGGAISGFTTAATASLQSLVGMTGTVAQMSTSLAAAGHTAAAGMQAGIQAFQMIPGWGWALAAVGALAAIFGKKSTPHMGAASSYSEQTGLVSGQNVYKSSGLADVRTYNTEVEKVTGSIAKNIADTLNATARAFGKTAGYEISTAFADDTSKDGAWGSLVIKLGDKIIDWRDTQDNKWAPKVFADGEEGQKQYLAAVAVSTRDALAQSLGGEKTGFGIAAPRVGGVGWALDMLMALGDSVTLESLAQAVAQINAFKLALDQMSKNLVGFSGITNEVVTALVRASGGVETLLANANTYYENFYSEAERNANTLRDIKDALAAVGLGLPTTRDEFRALVEEQMALGESGTTAVAALLGVSGAFASVIQPVDQLEESLKSISDSVINEINRLRGFTSGGTSSVRGLEQEFNRLTSNARQGDVGSFEKLANVSQLLEETYKATSGSEVEYMLRKAILANSLEQSYNSIKTTGVTLDSSAAIMGPPSLNAPVVNSIGSTRQEDSVGMLNAMQTLINEVSLLRAEVRADVVHNAKTAKILERVTPEGDALATRNEG